MNIILKNINVESVAALIKLNKLVANYVILGKNQKVSDYIFNVLGCQSIRDEETIHSLVFHSCDYLQKWKCLAAFGMVGTETLHAFVKRDKGKIGKKTIQQIKEEMGNEL